MRVRPFVIPVNMDTLWKISFERNDGENAQHVLMKTVVNAYCELTIAQPMILVSLSSIESENKERIYYLEKTLIQAAAIDIVLA